MDIPESVQHQINQFQQLQQQAQAVTVQKQSVDIQLKETETALEELKKTAADAEVFKTAGNLLIKVDQLRQQTMSRQEERVMKKLEEMQASIQRALGGA